MTVCLKVFDYKTEPAVLTLLQKQRVVCTSWFQFHNSFLEVLPWLSWSSYQHWWSSISFQQETFSRIIKGSPHNFGICSIFWTTVHYHNCGIHLDSLKESYHWHWGMCIPTPGGTWLPRRSICGHGAYPCRDLFTSVHMCIQNTYVPGQCNHHCID
jgi:hypothetical protein